MPRNTGLKKVPRLQERVQRTRGKKSKEVFVGVITGEWGRVGITQSFAGEGLGWY